MLIDDEIKLLLMPIPRPGFPNGAELPAASDDFDSLIHFLAWAAGKIVGIPDDFVPAFDQCEQVCQGNPLRSA